MFLDRGCVFGKFEVGEGVVVELIVVVDVVCVLFFVFEEFWNFVGDIGEDSFLE